MNINEVKLVLDVLNDRADKFKDSVFCLEKARKQYESLFDSVEKSDMSNDDKFCLENLILSRDYDISCDIVDFKSKIEAIDVFVAEISQCLNDNDETCLYVDLKEY